MCLTVLILRIYCRSFLFVAICTIMRFVILSFNKPRYIILLHLTTTFHNYVSLYVSHSFWLINWLAKCLLSLCQDHFPFSGSLALVDVIDVHCICRSIALIKKTPSVFCKLFLRPVSTLLINTSPPLFLVLYGILEILVLSCTIPSVSASSVVYPMAFSVYLHLTAHLTQWHCA